MRSELELNRKIAELRAQSPDWFLSLSKMDLSSELQRQVTEHLPYIQAGMLIGLGWSLGMDEKDLVSTLFDPEKLNESGFSFDDFDIR